MSAIVELPYASLGTRIMNSSGRTMFFGFLGQRGVSLTSLQEYICGGNFITRISRDSRLLASFVAALRRGDLDIVSTPAPHLYDETTDITQRLRINNGTVGRRNPEWGLFSST